MEKQAGIPGNIPSLSQSWLREAGLGCVERGRMESEALEKFFLDFFLGGCFYGKRIELPGARRSGESRGLAALARSAAGLSSEGRCPPDPGDSWLGTAWGHPPSASNHPCCGRHLPPCRHPGREVTAGVTASPRAARHHGYGKGQLVVHASATQPRTHPPISAGSGISGMRHPSLSRGCSGLPIPALIQSWGLTAN